LAGRFKKRLSAAKFTIELHLPAVYNAVESMIRPKRAAPSSSNPLCNDLFLELVLSYVGSGQGLYVSAVSRSWRAKYRAFCSASASSQQQRAGQHLHSSSCNLYSAVFSSKSRIQLALVNGLQLDADNHKLQRAAGSADLITLQAARSLGLSLISEVAYAAAAASSLAKLRWCIEQNCPMSDDIGAAVAAAGNLEMLSFLRQRGFVFSELTSYSAAATRDNLDVLMYLHDARCPWHEKACCVAAASCDLRQLQWLHAHGAPLHSEITWYAALGNSLPVFDWLLR
jgi:hypothetical protein